MPLTHAINLGIGGLVLNLILLEFFLCMEKRNQNELEKEKYYKNRKSKEIYIITYTVLGIILYNFLKYEINIYLTIPCYFCIIFVFGLARRAVSTKNILFNSLIVIITLLLVMFMINSILGNIKNNSHLMSFYACIYLLVWIIIARLSVIKLKMLSFIDWLLFLITIVISACIIIACYIVMHILGDNYMAKYMGLAIIAVLAIDFIIFYLIVQINDKYLKEKEYIQLQQESDMQQQYMENVKSMDEQVHRIRHDMKNQLNVINTLLDNEKYNDAKIYMNEYAGKSTVMESFVNTDNNIVNAVINSKLLKCKQNQIEITTTIHRHIKKIDDVEICSLLGNLLDNAIEAELKLVPSDRYIELEVTSQDGHTNVFIKNRVYQSILQNNPSMETDKVDAVNHGFGTKIIVKIVEKFNGNIDCYEQNKFFCCKINL